MIYIILIITNEPIEEKNYEKQRYYRRRFCDDRVKSPQKYFNEFDMFHNQKESQYLC